MNIDAITQLLLSIAPAIAAVISIVGTVIVGIKKIKNAADDSVTTAKELKLDAARSVKSASETLTEVKTISETIKVQTEDMEKDIEDIKKEISEIKTLKSQLNETNKILEETKRENASIKAQLTKLLREE